MNKIEIFTTSIVEGKPIEEYYGVVTANQVAGTGFFTDLTASFSDLFGGRSGAYRRAMDDLYKEVIEQLSNKALMLGANGVVGLTIDYDNISGKNMSMFMVSMQGTAVRFKETGNVENKKSSEIVSSDLLEYELNKLKYRHILEKNNLEGFLNESQWEYLLSHIMPELADLLFNCFVLSKKYLGQYELANICVRNFPIFLSKLPYQKAVELLYNSDNFNFDFIENLQLFNASKILEFAKNEKTLHDAIKLLTTSKSSYNIIDLNDMKLLVDYFQNLPVIGKTEEVKGGLFSSSGLKYVCKCGSKNDPNLEFCESCERNKNGLTRKEVNIINSFSEKVCVLEQILSK